MKFRHFLQKLTATHLVSVYAQAHNIVKLFDVVSVANLRSGMSRALLDCEVVHADLQNGKFIVVLQFLDRQSAVSQHTAELLSEVARSFAERASSKTRIE